MAAACVTTSQLTTSQARVAGALVALLALLALPAPTVAGGGGVGQVPPRGALVATADYAGPAVARATTQSHVPAWRWKDAEGWTWHPLAHGSPVWVEPFGDGWRWAWSERTGWLAVEALHLADAVAAPDHTGAAAYRSDGRFLRDRHGRAVFLHGVNAVWKGKPYYPPSALYGAPLSQSYFDERDGRFLERHGFNSVRLGVLFAGVEPHPNLIDESYLDRMRTITRMLERHGVSVLVDFHQDMYNERFRGEGFPDWASIDQGVRPTNCCGFPLNQGMPDPTWAWQDFWDNRANLWDHYGAAWAEVAERFSLHPNIVGYDLINEPFPGVAYPLCALPVGCETFETGTLQPFYERVIRWIRTRDMATPIWWEPNVMSVIGNDHHVGARRPLADPGVNTVLSFHAYCALGGIVPGITADNDPLCPLLQRRSFANAERAGARNGSPLALTEFGASDSLGDLQRMTALADQHMTSWHYWHYGSWKDHTTHGTSQSLFGDDLNRFATVKRAKLALLVRSYPRAVAGTPRAFRFHPERADRRFTLDYDADPAILAPTEIFVPVHVHYRGGYRVTISGPATRTSVPGAPVLTLRTTGAGLVRVVVERS